MNPVQFPEANTKFGPPPELEESQCHTVHAFMGIVQSGSMDGSKVCVVAWVPNRNDLEKINEGKPIFISMVGGLAPHFLSTDFQIAISPA